MTPGFTQRERAREADRRMRQNMERIVALTYEKDISIVEAARELGLRVEPAGTVNSFGTGIVLGGSELNAVILLDVSP